MCRIFPVLEMGTIISIMLLLQNRYVAIIANCTEVWLKFLTSPYFFL